MHCGYYGVQFLFTINENLCPCTTSSNGLYYPVTVGLLWLPILYYISDQISMHLTREGGNI